MHCPKCGQQQITDQTRFCSKCGFLLTGVAALVSNDGQLPSIGGTSQKTAAISPRRRGVYKGLFFFLISFLVVPMIAMISIAAQIEPFAVFAAVIIFTVGALLRAAYALMFESPVPIGVGGAVPADLVLPPGSDSGHSLTEGQQVQANVYSPPTTGIWRDTNDLAPTPGSVTDSTTKLLERDQ